LIERRNVSLIRGVVSFDTQTLTQADIDKIDSIIVNLYGSEETPLHTTTLKSFRFFEFVDLPAQDYEIKIDAKIASGHIIAGHHEKIDKSSLAHGVEKTFSVRRKEGGSSEGSPIKTNYFGPIFILIVIALLFNMDSIGKMYKKWNSDSVKTTKKQR